MNLDLNRVDYCFVGTTLPGAMKLLPGAYKQQQQVAIGDQEGVLQLFSIKKDETHVHFKTLPSDKIVTLRLGGGGPIADKLFVASDSKVRAFNRKGKPFLSFDLNLTEPIRSMCVAGNDLLVCGNHVYNQYRDGKDMGSYLCGDTIVDVVALCPNNTNRMIAVLACSGRVLRLLEHCRVRQTVELDSVPTVLYVPGKSFGDRLLCGYADGKVTLIRINHFAMDVKETVLIKADLGSSAVTALDLFDMSGEGRDDLLVGRRDGGIEVFSLPDGGGDDAGAGGDGDAADGIAVQEIRLLYGENFQESISSIQGGCVGANGYTEVLVSTYTGRVFGLTTQCIRQSLSDNATAAAAALMMSASTAGGGAGVLDVRSRLAKLTHEIDELETKVQKERERYQHSTQSMSDGISAIPMLPINDSMILSKEDGAYHLTIEIPTPIEFVLLQSVVPVKLLDVDQSTAVVSFSACDPNSPNQLLATYRCQVDTNRVDLRLRTVEGQHGALLAFVTPSLPPKVSQMRRYTLRPLSMHMRVHSADERRPYNVLRLRGAFSHAEMHNWLGQCVPELPPKIQAPVQAAPTADASMTDHGGSNAFYFRNVFTGTLLQCDYGKGVAVFKTDNISTLAILKDHLTKNATKKRIKLEIGTDINDASLPHMVRLLGAQLQQAVRTRDEHRLLCALLELDIRDETESRTLCDEWQAVLERRDAIVEAAPGESVRLDRLIGLLSDCYADRDRLRGISSAERLPRFVELLSDYDVEGVERFLDEGSQLSADSNGGAASAFGGGGDFVYASELDDEFN